MIKCKNKFQENILRDLPQFTIDDVANLQPSVTQDKIKALGLPRTDCKINDHFIDMLPDEAVYVRRDYCIKNCGFKCLRGYSFKRRSRCNWCNKDIETAPVGWKNFICCSEACLDACRAAQ